MGETPFCVPKSCIEGLMTVPPISVTEPRQTRKVSSTGTSPVGLDIFTRCIHVVMYYKNVGDEEYGWYMPEWIKQTLGRAFSEFPLIAGRLRRGEDGDGELEIVSNDSGMRLIESTIPISLEEFLVLKNTHDVENEVVFWMDIDQHIPQFSPLFYIQVTNFKCGGYALGISCSILLADILVNPNFFNKWVNTINKVKSENMFPKFPLFYLPRLKTNTPISPNYQFISSAKKNCGKTMIFNSNSEKINKTLAFLSIGEAKTKFCSKMENGVSLFMKEENNEEIKIEFFEKNGGLESQTERNGSEIIGCGNWDDFGAKRVAFSDGNYPQCVSYWIGSNHSSNGIVFVLPSLDEIKGVKFIVSIPIEREN